MSTHRYTQVVSIPADLPRVNPAGMEAIMVDIVELWKRTIARAGWLPVGESISMTLRDAALDSDQQMIEVSGRVESIGSSE